MAKELFPNGVEIEFDNSNFNGMIKKTKELIANGTEVIYEATFKEDGIFAMAGYFDMIQNDETVIYGVFDNNTLQFAVEICEGRLIQASGKNNSQLEPNEQEVLDMWMRRFFEYENGVGVAA